MSAYVNNPYTQGSVIRPRMRVFYNNQLLPSPLEAMVESNGYFQADRFSVSFAATPPTGVGSVNWWAAIPQPDASAIIDVQFGIIPQGAPEGSSITWQSMVQGQVDTLSYYADSNIVTVAGRDLTARMIDTKTQNAYVNQTSSQIVSAIALAHGLLLNVKPTTTPVGRYWDAEHDALQLNQFHSVTTEWDLITTLARFEGFNAYVATPNGGSPTMYFNPPAAPNTVPAYIFLWQQDSNGSQTGNVKSLEMQRAFTIAKGVVVTVKSWNSKQARSFTRTAGSATNINRQNHIYIRPNLTEDQAQQLANSIYKDIVAHEMKISCTLPGDMVLTPQSIIRLVGTKSNFDQVYYPQTITRRISVEGGFVMHITAKNSNETTTNAGAL